MMQVPKSITRAETAKAASIVIIGVAALLLVLLVRSQRNTINNQNKSTECRFDINAEVQAIDDEVDLIVARIVIAAVREDDVRVLELAVDLEELTTQLEQASERRANAVETCNARNS